MIYLEYIFECQNLFSNKFFIEISEIHHHKMKCFSRNSNTPIYTDSPKLFRSDIPICTIRPGYTILYPPHTKRRRKKQKTRNPDGRTRQTLYTTSWISKANIGEKYSSLALQSDFLRLTCTRRLSRKRRTDRRMYVSRYSNEVLLLYVRMIKSFYRGTTLLAVSRVKRVLCVSC